MGYLIDLLSRSTRPQEVQRLGADATGLPPMRSGRRLVLSRRGGKREYVKLHTLFNRVYRLRRGMVALWRSLKSIVGDPVGSKTVPIIKAEIWAKITCHDLVWTIRRNYGF